MSIVTASISACGRSSAAEYVTNEVPRATSSDVRHLSQHPRGLARSAPVTVTRSVTTLKKLTVLA